MSTNIDKSHAMLVSLLTILLVQAPAPGCQEGIIGTGPRQRRVVLERSSGPTATLHVHGRPSRTIALVREPGAGHMHSADGRVSVSPGSGGVVTLVMRGPRDTMVTALHPAAPAAAAAMALAGEWHGRLGPGGTVRLGIRLVADPCGMLAGYVDSPDQGQRDLPLTAAYARNDSLVLEAVYMDLRIALPLAGGDERSATYAEPGVRQEITLRRGSVHAAVRRPQEPARPFPYAEREVELASRAAGVRLAGTLTLPAGSGPHPAILLISGSGGQDRDETVAGHRPFLILSDRLTRHGYAVLRLDDRGVGRSTGPSALQSNLHDVAEDIRGALDHLRALPDIDPRRIGLLGHSEGGYVAPIVAAGDSAVAFLLFLGAPAVRGRELLTAQRTLLTRASGAPEPMVRVDSLMIGRIFDVLDRRPVALELAVDSALAQWRRDLSDEDRVIAETLLARRTAAQDSASLRLWSSRWFESIYHHDPEPLLHRIGVPTFVVIGELDLQVPAAQSIPAFEAAFAGERRRLLTVQRPPMINHMLQTARTGAMEEYMTIEETVAPVVLDGILAWLAGLRP